MPGTTISPFVVLFICCNIDEVVSTEIWMPLIVLKFHNRSNPYELFSKYNISNIWHVTISNP